MAKLVKVWEVLADGPGDGPACDGTHIHRFRNQKDALAFAHGKTLYGKPDVPVTCVEAPAKLARRWGIV